MDNGIFMDKAQKPDVQMLSVALDSVFEYYSELANMTLGYKTDWSYTKAVGWMQKTADAKKALFYLIPYDKAFLVRLTVRESERAVLLNEPQISFAHEALAEAKKYSEGYLMEFLVNNGSSFNALKLFLNQIIKIR